MNYNNSGSRQRIARLAGILLGATMFVPVSSAMACTTNASGGLDCGVELTAFNGQLMQSNQAYNLIGTTVTSTGYIFTFWGAKPDNVAITLDGVTTTNSATGRLFESYMTNSTINIRNSTLTAGTAASGYFMNFFGGSSGNNVTITNTTINAIVSTTNIIEVVASDAVSPGNHVTFDGVHATGSFNVGILTAGLGSTVTIKNTTFDSTVRTAISNYANGTTDDMASVLVDGSTLSGQNTYGVIYLVNSVAGRSNPLNVTVNNSTLTSTSAMGIYASGAANQNTNISATGNTLINAATYGINAYSNGTGTTAVVLDHSAIVAGSSGYGIFAASQQFADVKADGGTITSGLTGIYASGGSQGASVLATDTVFVTTGASNADGIRATASASSPAVSVETHGGSISTSGSNSRGIYASGTGTTQVTVLNDSAITTRGASSAAILVQAANGNAFLTNSGALSTTGQNASGISASSTNGAVNASNSGAITVSGATSNAISAVSTVGPVTVNNTGNIIVSGTGVTRGIFAQGNGVTVNSSGNITQTGPAPVPSGASIFAYATAGDARVDASGNISTNVWHGIEALASMANASASVHFQDGAITVSNPDSAFGIAVWNGGINQPGTGSIIIGPNAMIDVAKGIGLQARQETANYVEVAAGSKVIGGYDATSGSAVAFSSDYGNVQQNRLVNNGDLGSRSDVVVLSGGMAAGSMTALTNSATGTMTGVMQLGNGINTLDNAGQWNLRRFADTDGDGVRDTLSVAVSDFGGSGANAVTNTGTIALVGADSAPVTTLDATGAYLPKGYAVNAPTVSGPVQGQILNVQTFTNSGVIDLTANPAVGDVLVISGGTVAGSDGSGVFVANGGTVRLNTVLNEGGSNAQSDVLVIDATRLGSGPTALAVAPVGTASGTLTTGDGILLVEVLNKSASPDGIFRLGSRLVAGPYEYLLFHNGVGADANDGNWYLRNVYTPQPPAPPVPIIRPEVPISVVIPPLALEYGYAMLDTLHERVGETYLHLSDPATEERMVWCKDAARNFKCVVRVPVASANGAAKDETRWASSGWARLIGNRGFHEPDNFYRRGPNYDYTFGGIQAGLDVYARERRDGTLDKAGIYVGYGQITSNVKGQPGAFYGGKAGSVDMDAYTLGGYWTHHSADGWYTDAVVQGTWYAADAKSVLGQQIKPDGFGILGSLEGGYAFKLGNGFTLEPQAQIVYQNVSFDNVRATGAFVRFDDGDSLRGRLGLRLIRTWNRAEEGKEPRLITAWVRANVWHEFLGKTQTSWGSLDGQNMVPFYSYLGGTWGELGAGVTAQVTDKINLFATGAYNRSLDNKGREGWDGRLGMTVKW